MVGHIPQVPLEISLGDEHDSLEPRDVTRTLDLLGAVRDASPLQLQAERTLMLVDAPVYVSRATDFPSAEDIFA